MEERIEITQTCLDITTYGVQSVAPNTTERIKAPFNHETAH
jgi:hypothetical protein